jgi:hypothetical protein
VRDLRLRPQIVQVPAQIPLVLSASRDEILAMFDQQADVHGGVV